MELFIQRNRIKLEAHRTAKNPLMKDSADIDHWKVTLARGSKRMTLTFSQGSGFHGAEPTAEGVLECLQSDSSVDGMDFDEWCGNLGFDPDSRTAERTYKACSHQNDRLKRFLGDVLYRELTEA